MDLAADRPDRPEDPDGQPKAPIIKIFLYLHIYPQITPYIYPEITPYYEQLPLSYTC